MKSSESTGLYLVSPSPDLQERLKSEMQALRDARPGPLSEFIRIRREKFPGMDDGQIYPGPLYEAGTPMSVIRSAAAQRAPLRGTINVAVILVQFSDQMMDTAHTQQYYRDLFFSTGVRPRGSVREYFREASNNLVDIQGDVAGPYLLPRTMAAYAHGHYGTTFAKPNAQTMAYDAAVASNPNINFAPYDNDGDGFVDAFIVIHAGQGAEETGNVNQIWSHKWTLDGGVYNADGTQIFGYLTVPETCQIGVCCHEMGHLLFGWPDLYDTDDGDPNEGVGNWCLMGSGNWNGISVQGDTPGHPSAYCKASQGWITVNNVTANIPALNIQEVKTSCTAYKLWKNGAGANEYFLVENRQKTAFDAALPGQGLLIWHIDESISDNTDGNHPKVALEQADGRKDLLNGANRGDAGDPYPGTSNNRTFNHSSNPSSDSYAGAATLVSVDSITDSAAVMCARVQVRLAVKSAIKDYVDNKHGKDLHKELGKEILKDLFKDTIKDIFDHQPVSKAEQPQEEAQPMDLESRVAYLEQILSQVAPFIGAEIRPDLSRSALLFEKDQPAAAPEQKKPRRRRSKTGAENDSTR